MKKKLLGIFLLITTLVFAQEKPILISEQTVKMGMGETKEFYYSLAENDEILFDFQMIKGKNLKELEFIELPSNTLFSEYKVVKLNNKSVRIRNKGIYKLKFYSSSLSKRVIKFKLQRKPENEEKRNFNTNWKWKILRDTTYIPYTKDSITGYKKIKYTEKIKELVKTEITDDMRFDKIERLHSLLSEKKNSTFLRVDIPKPIITDLKEERVISWAYWIGVGKEGQEAYKKNKNAFVNLATKLTTTFATPLAGFAVGEFTKMIIPEDGEDVTYALVSNYENASLFVNGQNYFQFDHGKGRSAYGKNSDRNNGTFYICLYNDNQITPIDVNVKFVVIKEIKSFEYKEYEREKEEPIIITLNKKRMEVKETKIRIPVE